MSKLRRKRQQMKKIAAEKLEPTPAEQVDQQDKRRKNIEPLPKQYKIIVYTFFAVVLVGVITLVLVLALKDRKPPELPERYEGYTQISTNHYKALVSSISYDPAELEDEDREIYDSFKDDLKNDIYIFVYNPDYDESPRSEELESFIKSIYDKTNKSFTLLIMNFAENKDIFEVINSNIEHAPALLHIDGDLLKQTYTTPSDIKLQLIED